MLLVAALMLLSGCGTESGGGGGAFAAAEASQAALGKSDSKDLADQECKVVLRSAGRVPGEDGYLVDCTSGSCLFVWEGQIDVAEDLPPEATVHLLYHPASTPEWWEVEATAAPSSPPGFRRYQFAISEQLFGPGGEEVDGAAIELVAFVRYADGARLFDHNRYAGDFENHMLTAENGFATSDGGVCQPVLGWVDFLADWQEVTAGERRQGGYLQIGYELSRLPDCRGTHNGYPAWNIVAHAQFLPGGQHFEGSVRSFVSNNGQPTTEATAVPFVVAIPEGATGVELWFHNYSGAGSSCQAWDSNLGDNYYFDIWPAADDPKCAHVERENGMNTESEHMVHMSSFCLPYELAQQADASFCEFHVDGFGNGHLGHYGIPIDWLVAYLRTGTNDGEVLNVGMYTLFLDNKSGKVGERFSLGMPVSEGVWKTGFNYFVTGFQSVQAVDVTVDEFAFFIDVKRPSGEVVRLWQSNGGTNYTWGDAFDMPVTVKSIPYGNVKWANDAAPVYNSRSSCAVR